MKHDTPSSPAAPVPSPALAMRLRGLAWWVRGLALLGALALLALPPWILLAAAGPDDPVPGLYGGGLMHLLQGEMTPAVRARLAGVTVLPVAVALAALWQLWALFGAYRRGDVFGPRPLGHMRRFGWSMAALALIEPLSRSLASVAVSLDNPPGQRQLVVTLGSHDYALLMCALVFVAVARVMAEAGRLAAENEGFV